MSDSPHVQKLSERQTASLKGIIDALLPSLDPPASCKDDASRAFWTHRLASDPDFILVLDETITTRLPATESFLLSWLLSLLSTWIGTALVFGTLQPIWTRQAFSQWTTPSQQTAALKILQLNRWKEKRKIFNGLKRLICGLAFSFVPTGETKNNPFWEAAGYPGPYEPKSDKQDEEERIKGARDFRKEKEVMIEITEDTKLSYDVVIVGSGAGGGVAAATLAAKGYSVLIIEKGPYVSPSEVNYLEAESLDKMYESHGLLTTSDGNMMILAGSTLGGGTTVNWSCCLPLPEHVREEWVNKHGLRQFAQGQEFDMAMDAVMNRIGCKDKSKVTHNVCNQKLIDGCKEMKYEWETTGQNLKSTMDDTAGYICFGDKYGNKQSGLVTYLADAVDHGAKIIENCRVEQILQGLYNAPGGRRRRRALGVVGRVNDYKVEVRARKCVISAAGALNTPCLLQRSWLGNRHIGRHLHLHPVAAVSGFFDETQVIECFRGAPMTTVCQEFQQGPGKDGYGAKIECPSAHSGLLATGLQFIDPQHYREQTMRLKHVAPLVVLQRDSSEGRVRLGDDGYGPKVDYAINDADKHSMTEALKGAVKILIASGAQLVLTSHTNDPGLELSPTTLPRTRADINDDAEIQLYLHQIDERGFRDHEMLVFGAHQMGSCRMGISPDAGAVDENGESWEVDDLFVFDTSIFPTASGANPQMAVMAISRMLSTRLLLRFLHEDERLTQVVEEVSHAMDVLRLARLRVSQSNYSPLTSIYFAFLACLMPTVIVWYFWSPNIRLTERMGLDAEL